MPDETTTDSAPPAEAQPEPAQPAPPPYEPDRDLIGYVEKGQNPPLPRSRPSERR